MTKAGDLIKAFSNYGLVIQHYPKENVISATSFDVFLCGKICILFENDIESIQTPNYLGGTA